jgi:hypothetical protein
MRFRHGLALSSLILIAAVAPVRAEGRWSVNLSAGESVSQHHGSALDARALAQVDPLLGLGIETGVAYMTQPPGPPVLTYAAGPGGGIGNALASVTDGITRNRGYYLGPAVRVGRTLYAIASTGLYEFTGNEGQFSGTRWGMSAGLGLTGHAHFAPSAELRYRWSQDASSSATAWLFTVGLHIQ